MCGIAGYVSTTDIDGQAMLASIGHRGPDAFGGFRASVAGQQVFLGHARLSIIDLSSAGHQPMFADGERIALVYNGEIYNFQELRDRHLRGVRLQSRTDTEVALRLYEKLGIDFVHELNGDFAIAILDQRRGKLLLIRDRVGVKPVYFAQRGDRFLFGSEIKSLIAGGLQPRLDAAGLQRFFVFKYTPAADTLFEGVRRLEPGHYLELDIGSGHFDIRRYWDPGFQREAGLDYAEAKSRLRSLIEDATRIRLVADVPVGTFLSGGIDSSIIAGLLRDQAQITHYCARQGEEATQAEGTVSDYAYAQRLAAEWKLSLKAVDLGASTVTREQVHTTCYYGDDLIADSAQVPCYLITRGAAGTSKVFLSGMGADEILLGYPGHQLSLLWKYIQGVPFGRAVLGMFAGIDQGRGAFKAFRRYLYRLGKYRSYPDYRYGIFNIVGDFETSAAVVKGDREQLVDFLEGYFPQGADPFDCFKRFEFENFLQKNLSYVDRMSMANSVEVRVPYLDHRVVEFAYSLPTHFKLGRFGRTKRVLVDAFSDLLPDYIVRRRKAGFGMPIRSLFGDPAKIRSLLDEDALADVGAFDVDHVRALITSHVEGREDNSSIIYALISFQQWHSTFFGAGRGGGPRP